MVERRWIPRIETTRRIAGRLLRAHRGGNGVALGALDVDKCVDGLTRPFLSAELRRSLGVLWLTHGAAVIASGHEDMARRHRLDDGLDSLVAIEVE